MPLTPIKANQFLQQLNGKSATLYLGLASAQPSNLQDDGCTTNEITNKEGYGRAVLNNTAMSTAASGSTKNEQTIYFPEVTDTNGWGLCRYILLFDSLTPKGDGSDLLAYGQISGGGVTPANGQVPLLRPNQLTMTMT